jgi:hypothetical protein
MSRVDVRALIDSLEKARGEPLADDDPMWTLGQHLYAHAPAFPIDQLVSESMGPVNLGVSPALHDPHLLEAALTQLRAHEVG